MWKDENSYIKRKNHIFCEINQFRRANEKNCHSPSEIGFLRLIWYFFDADKFKNFLTKITIKINFPLNIILSSFRKFVPIYWERRFRLGVVLGFTQNPTQLQTTPKFWTEEDFGVGVGGKNCTNWLQKKISGLGLV